jgi:hypothetical protein
MQRRLEVDALWLERIAGSLNGLEYGTVQIVVHDGAIMQIDRTERRRFEAEPARAAAAPAPGAVAHRRKQRQ